MDRPGSYLPPVHEELDAGVYGVWPSQALAIVVHL